MFKNKDTHAKRSRRVIGGICVDHLFKVNKPIWQKKNRMKSDGWAPGGGAANVSVAHRSLAPNRHITLFAAVGEDADGRNLALYMKERGIKMPVKPVRTHETSFSHIYVDEDSRASTIFSAPGARAAPIPLDQVERSMLAAEALCLVAPFVNDQIAPILDIAAKFGVPVYFGLGSRQINVLGYSGLADSLTQKVEMVICNRDEAARLTGTSELSEQLRALQFGGKVRVAVVTEGPRGIHAVSDEGGSYHVPAYTDGRPVVDDTGAGDAAEAAIVDTLLRGKPLEIALLAGARLGFEACTAAGATTNLLSAEEMKAYMASVTTATDVA